ncbi:hypothetical protein [Pseudomonas sp. 25 R 14]|nr:hypothetical protein [Pseudomonas sp. 25 R 14]
MFKRYPSSYKMPVYATHRTASVPDNVLAAIRQNAVKAHLVGLEGFGTAVPFPIPQSGLEGIWNHLTHYRGTGVSRLIAQLTPQVGGAYSLVRFQDQLSFLGGISDFDPAKQANLLYFFKQEVLSLTRLSGSVVLVHDTINQVKDPRMAWVYNAESDADLYPVQQLPS